MAKTFVGGPGTETNRPLGPEFQGPVQEGNGGPGGTDIPETAGADQNCAGESLGLNEYINWPHLGLFIEDREWDQAKNFVPQGWVRISCDGIRIHQTRCLCTERESEDGAELVEEIEVILFLYRWPVGFAVIGGRRYRVWQSDFHMIGRSACGLPSGWHSKKGEREKVEFINAPLKNLHSSYPRTLRGDHEVVQLCFCAQNTTFG